MKHIKRWMHNKKKCIWWKSLERQFWIILKDNGSELSVTPISKPWQFQVYLYSIFETTSVDQDAVQCNYHLFVMPDDLDDDGLEAVHHALVRSQGFISMCHAACSFAPSLSYICEESQLSHILRWNWNSGVRLASSCNISTIVRYSQNKLFSDICSKSLLHHIWHFKMRQMMLFL